MRNVIRFGCGEIQCVGVLAGRVGDSMSCQQFAALGEVTFCVVVAQAAETTTLRVARRKNVQAPAAHEFHRRKCHRFDLVTAAVDRACAGRECDSVSIVIASGEKSEIGPPVR